MMNWFNKAIPNLTDADRELLIANIDYISYRVDLLVLGGTRADEAFIGVCKEYLVVKSDTTTH